MICTEHDNFIIDFNEMQPHWIVSLNSGLVVYQDDGRPNTKGSAWERLSEYCKNNNDYITSMSFGFRNNMRSLPSNMDGYFFCKGAMGCFGSTKTLHYFVVGFLNNGIVTTTRWKVPEMLEQETETRDPKKAGLCLINKNINQSLAQQA